MAFIENSDGTRSLQVPIDRPAIIRGRPGEFVENPDRIPEGYNLTKDNIDLQAAPLEDEPVEATPVEGSEITSRETDRQDFDDMADIHNQLAQIGLSERVEEKEEKEPVTDLTLGDVGLNLLGRGLGADVEGLSLTPADEEYDPYGFLADPASMDEMKLQQASFIRAEQSAETVQLDDKDKRSYILWFLHNERNTFRTYKEYENSVNAMVNQRYISMLSHDPLKYREQHKGQRNPYFNNPQMLMRDLMRDPNRPPDEPNILPMPRRNADLEAAKKALDNATTDAEKAEAEAEIAVQEARGEYLIHSLENNGRPIAARSFESSMPGQLYYDPESNSILYNGTFLENLNSAATELGLAATRGVVEIPNFLVQISGLIDMGLNYTAKGGMNGLQFMFDQVGLEVDLEVEEQFNKAMEAASQGMLQFSAEYENAIGEEFRKKIGKFGVDGGSTTVEDRLVEELAVAGWIAIPFLQRAVTTGKKKARQFMAESLRQESIVQTTSVRGAESASAIIANTREKLKRYVDEDVFNSLNTMPQEEALAIISQVLGQGQARSYKASLDFLQAGLTTNNKALMKAAQRYSAVPLAQTTGRGMSEITAAREVAAVGASELMMNLGFVVAEDMYPDDIVLQMGAGLFGGWWGMRGKNYAMDDGPLGVTGKARSYFGPNGGNFQVNLYSALKFFHDTTGSESAGHMAENTLLRYLGKYDDFVRDYGEDASLAQKKQATAKFATDRGEFKALVNQVEKTRKILQQMPDEDLRQILGKAEQIQAAVQELIRADYSPTKLHETLSDTFAIPVLNMLELQLLNKIDVGLSLKMNRIPLISEYHSILKLKQANLQSIKETLDAIGNIENLGPESTKLREHMRKFYAQEKQSFDVSFAKLENKIKTEYAEYKDMITNPISPDMRTIRTEGEIDIALNLGIMDQPANQLGHHREANARFGEVLESTLDELDAAYSQVDHNYQFKNTDEMASLLEEIVHETVKVPDPTRSVVGVEPKAAGARKILYTARLKHISRQLKRDRNLQSQKDYLYGLEDTVLARNPDAAANNTVLSATSREKFEIAIEDLIEAEDYTGIQSLINDRAGKIAQVDVPDSGIGAVYTMAEFAKLRSFVTTKSVSHSNGQTRYSYRTIREKMDDLINSADPKDAEAVEALKKANKLNRKYSLLFKTGTGAKLMSTDAQGRSVYGNHYLDSDRMATDPKGTDLQSTIPSEYNIFENFLAPLFKASPDKMNESFNTFQDMFLQDGKLASSDADLLIDNFAIHVGTIRRKNTKGVQKQEQAAYLNFMERYGPLIKESNPERYIQLERLGKLYSTRFPEKGKQLMEKRAYEAHQRTQELKRTTDLDEATTLLKQFFNLRNDALGNKNSVFAQLASKDFDSAQGIAAVLFGKGEQGAESQIKRSPSMYPYVTRETLENLEQKRRVLRGVDPEDVVGPTSSGSLKPNFVQVVEHLEDARATKFIDEKQYQELKKSLATLLMDDMLKTVYGRVNKQNLNVNPEDLAHGIFGISKLNRATNLARELHSGRTGMLFPKKGGVTGEEITSSFTEYNVNAAKMEDYLRNNRKAFEALFSKEHVDKINAAFKTSWAMGTEKVDETFSGLFQGYSASSLQSYFWAAARNVVSIRFVAGMLGFQAYRQGTTRFFNELLMNENNTAVLMKAMRDKVALTTAQEASFRKVFAASFGPHAASYLTKDAMVKIREDWQRDQEEQLNQQEVNAITESPFYTQQLSDDSSREIAAGILDTTPDQIPAGVNPGTLEQQLAALQAPPSKGSREAEYERALSQAGELFPDGRVPVTYRPQT